MSDTVAAPVQYVEQGSVYVAYSVCEATQATGFMRKQETWNFHENQAFQQLHERRIWIREDN